MARIDFSGVPTVEPSHQGLAYESIPTSPAMFGGLVAGAEQTLGQGIEAAGNAGLHYLEAKNALNNEVHANDKLTWFAQQGTTEWEKYKQLEGQSAVNALPQFQQRLDELRKQTLEGENLQVQAHLSRGLSSLMDRYSGWAAGHAGSQERQWHDKSAIDGAKTFGSQAVLSAQNGTWDQVDQDLHASDERIGTYWRQKNPSLDPDSRAIVDEEVRKNRGGNVKYIVETLANQGQLKEAQAVFDRYKDRMDAQSIAVTTGYLRGKQKDEHARERGNDAAERAIAETRGLTPGMAAVNRDAAAALAGKGITLDMRSGFRTPEHNAEVGGARGSQHLHGRAGDYSLNGLSEDQARAVIDQFLNDPRVGGFGYYPRSNSIHVDVRPGGRAAWGSDYHNTSVGEGWPAWMTEKVRAWQGSAAARQNMPEEFGPLDRASAYNRLIEKTQDDPHSQSYGITRLNQIFSVERDERTAGIARFNRQIDDTLAEARETGNVKVPLTEEDFVEHRKPGESDDDARERYRLYDAERQFRSDQHAMEDMTAAELQTFVNGRPPSADSPGGWAAAVAHRDRLQKEMDAVIAKRRKDPAGSVAKDPAVLDALKDYDPHRPETFRPVADARMAAQAQLGIEAQFRFPITREEAQLEAGPVYRALPGQETPILTAMMNRFRAMFGPKWPDAMAYALAQGHEDQASRDFAAATMMKFLKDPANAAARREADRAAEQAAASSAVAAVSEPAPTPRSEEDLVRQAQQDRQLAARELQDLDKAETSRLKIDSGGMPSVRLQREIDKRREEIFAKYPDMRAPFEAAQARHREQEASGKFESEIDRLAAEEGRARPNLAAVRTANASEAGRLRPQHRREASLSAEIAAIADRRKELVMMERRRLGVRADTPFTWPADAPFPRAADITALFHNPALAQKFDAEWGRGAARRFLGTGE
jgi:hypothetical protein